VKTRKAFLTVEVLISIVIIFMAIVIMTSSIKTVTLFDRKATQYETNYITVKSVLNYIQKLEIDLDNITANYTKIDSNLTQLNKYDIVLEAKKLKETYIKDIDSFGNVSNSKNKVILLQMKITLKSTNSIKIYEIYMTRVLTL